MAGRTRSYLRRTPTRQGTSSGDTRADSVVESCLSLRRNEGPALSEQDQVVSVDQLRFVDVAQDSFDFRRGLAQDALRLCGAVIDQPARDFPSVGVAAADHFAALEQTFASDDTDRQQALAL